MIYLRELSGDDIGAINRFRKERELYSSLVSPFRHVNIECDKEWFISYQNNRENNVRCVICLKETSEIIGAVYLLNINWIHRSAEMNIFIGNDKHRRKGYGREATLQMIRHGFFDLGLHRIQLKLLESNAHAISLYKKLGFKEEGILRESAFKDNEYNNTIVMGLLKSEFIERND